MRIIRDISIGVGGFMLTAVRRELFIFTNLCDTLGKISDCFVISGMILFGLAALLYVNSEGIFDMLTYSAYSLVSMDRTGDYYEYRLSRSKIRKRPIFTVILGAVFFSFGVLFLIIFLTIN